MLLPRPPAAPHTHTGAEGSQTEKPSPRGWSHVQSYMQDREIPKSHNRRSQAEDGSVGGGSDTRALSCTPGSTAGAGVKRS